MKIFRVFLLILLGLFVATANDLVLAVNPVPLMTNSPFKDGVNPECGDPCTDATSCCGGVCVDVRTDDNNCGSCGTICEAGQTCTNGSCFAPTYTITYDGNSNTEGTAPTDGGAYENGATVTVLDNTGTLVKTGYAFSGWNTAADGGGVDRAAASTFSMGSDDVVLYAKWTKLGSISGGIRYDNLAATPLDGLSVTLWKDGSQVGSPYITTTTLYAAGKGSLYTFTDLVPGTYTIVIASAAGSWQTHGSVNATDAGQVNFYAGAPYAVEPVRLLAGDVTAPHPDITAADATAIQRIFVFGYEASGADIPKWVFAGESAALGNFVINGNDIVFHIQGLWSGDFNKSGTPPAGNK